VSILQIERINISIDVGFTLYRFGKDRPCIVFISGISDSDACGIALLKKFVEELKDKNLHGSLLVIPQINELNLNVTSCHEIGEQHIFCKIIEKLVRTMPRECIIVVLRCRKDFVEHIVIPQEINDNIKNFVEATPIEFIVKTSGKGIISVLRKARLNTVSIILNGGREFDLNYIEKFLNILTAILSNLNIVKRKSKQQSQQIIHRYFEGYYIVKCSNRGIFIPKIQKGIEISKGTSIGSIENNEVISEKDGLVLYISNPKLCNLNEVLAIIAIESKNEEVNHL
jgi:predicted deacylase